MLRIQPLYLREVLVRFAYIISSLDLTCGISLGVVIVAFSTFSSERVIFLKNWKKENETFTVRGENQDVG